MSIHDQPQQVSTIDANTRDFEVELQAQQERNGMPQTELHAEATVITATAL